MPAVWNQYFKPSPVAKGLAEGFFIDVGAGESVVGLSMIPLAFSILASKERCIT